MKIEKGDSVKNLTEEELIQIRKYIDPDEKGFEDDKGDIPNETNK